MSTPAEVLRSPLDRCLTAIAARDHKLADSHHGTALRERAKHGQIGRAARLERTAARCEADSAELRAMRGEH
jgi:hypothetical protein